jgi:hypothetical protein
VSRGHNLHQFEHVLGRDDNREPRKLLTCPAANRYQPSGDADANDGCVVYLIDRASAIARIGREITQVAVAQLALGLLCSPGACEPPSWADLTAASARNQLLRQRR